MKPEKQAPALVTEAPGRNGKRRPDSNRSGPVKGGSALEVVKSADRVPPHNLEAEESVLGSMMLSAEALVHVIELVRSADFYRPAHARIFETLRALHAREEPVDAITAIEELKRNGLLEEVGGHLYIHQLVDGVPAPTAAPSYARIVTEAAQLRRVISTAADIMESAYSFPENPSEVIAYARDAFTEELGEAGVAERLRPRSVREVRDAVREAGPRSFLVEGVIVEGTHGVLGAVPKAGKGWDAVDLAVSVASGTPWLGQFACMSGPVLLYAAEEDEHELIRRLEAVARSRGLDLDALPIHLVFGTPKALDAQELARMEVALERLRPVLTILDPLYRSAAGADSGKLYGMGEVLGNLEQRTRAVGSALFAVTHYNRNTGAKGPDRFTGAGPQEWGRFLIGADVKGRRERDGGTEIVRRVTVQGTSIADHSFTVRRFVRAENPRDPSSPLTYEVEVTESAEEHEGLSFSLQRVLDVLPDSEGPLTVKRIGDRLAEDGRGSPYKSSTIRDKLSELRRQGLADSEGAGGTEKTWWRTEG